MNCQICGEAVKEAFTATVLSQYKARFDFCQSCGFLGVYKPHWLDEAYSSAIAAADTGLVMRNISHACKLSAVLYWLVGRKREGRFMDAAGGYGMLTRLMRDFGFDFYWNDKYCDNLLAPGFEYRREQGPCSAVTAMEVFEHLTDPVAFIEETLAFSGAQTLIFTTELYNGCPPKPDAWWYYAFATGQHIGFYQRRTLETLGAKLGLRFVSANGLHILSKTAVDERLLRIVTANWVSYIAPWWIRRRLGTKTMDDHQLMLRKIG